MSDLVNGYALTENSVWVDTSVPGSGFGSGYMRHDRVIIDENGKEMCALPANWIEGGWGYFMFEEKRNGYAWDLEYNNYSEGLVNISYIKPLGKGHLSELVSSEEEPEWLDDYRWTLYNAYMDLDGNIVIPADAAFTGRGGMFCDGLAWAGDRTTMLYGYIDKSGEWVIPAQYTGASGFSEGYAYVFNADGKYGYIDTQGNMVIPMEYDGAFGYASGLFVVGRMQNGVIKYGAVDRNNQVVVPLEYDDISSFEQGVGYGIKDGYVDVISIVKKGMQQHPESTPETEPAGGTVRTMTVEEIGNAQVGDIVTFGAYEQDSDFDNGEEPIEWYVLENDGSQVTLLSVYLLDCKQYHTEFEDITWENCFLRSWLNSEFYDSAFTETEKRNIRVTNVVNADNPFGGTEDGSNGGNDTLDRIWLLSYEEMERYFHIPMTKETNPAYNGTLNGWWEYAQYCFNLDYRVLAKTTAYAQEMGCHAVTQEDAQNRYFSYAERGGWWWMRSPGCNGVGAAASVGPYGNVINVGSDVDCLGFGVRPALKLKYGLE